MSTMKWNVLLDNSEFACITKAVLIFQVKYVCKEDSENVSTFTTTKTMVRKAPQRALLKWKV